MLVILGVTVWGGNGTFGHLLWGQGRRTAYVVVVYVVRFMNQIKYMV